MVPVQTLAALKAADQLVAVPRVAAQLAVAECKAVVLQAGPARRVAAPRVVVADFRQPGAEPLAVAPMVRKAAVLRVVVVAAA